MNEHACIELSDLLLLPEESAQRVLSGALERLSERARSEGAASPAGLLLRSLRIRARATEEEPLLAELFDALDDREGQRILAAAGTSAADVAARIAGDVSRSRTVSVPLGWLRRWILDPADRGVQQVVRSGKQAWDEAWSKLEEKALLDRFSSPSLGSLGDGARGGDERKAPETRAIEVEIEVCCRPDALTERVLPGYLVDRPHLEEVDGRQRLVATLRTALPLKVPADHEWSFYMVPSDAGEDDHVSPLCTPARAVLPQRGDDDRAHLQGRFEKMLPRDLASAEVLDPARWLFVLGGRRRGW